MITYSLSLIFDFHGVGVRNVSLLSPNGGMLGSPKLKVFQLRFVLIVPGPKILSMICSPV